MRDDRRSLDLGTSMPSPQVPTTDTQVDASQDVPIRATGNAKTPKVRRTAPAGAVIPDRGWPKYQYMINKFFGRPDKVPEITDAQRQELQLNERLAHKAALIGRLRHLVNQGIKPIMVFANIKSAGKSTDAIGALSVIAEYGRVNVLLIPSTANTATATAGLMAGISGNTITVDELMENIKEFGAYRALATRVPRTKNGLGVVIEDSKSAANEDDADKVKLFMKMTDTVIPNVDVLGLDLGNDNISKQSIALQSARLGHVLNFPFLLDKPVTHDTLRRTLDGYNTDEGIPEDIERELYAGFENKNYAGLHETMRNKVRRSVVIANMVPPGASVDFSDYTRSHTQGAHATDLPIWEGTGVCVPLEPSFAMTDDQGHLVPFDLEKIMLDTEIGFLEIAVANFEVAGFITNVNIGTPMVAVLPSRKDTP